jgi:hypothetical protein
VACDKPRSRAAREADNPCSNTRATASALNSVVYDFLANLTPCLCIAECPAQRAKVIPLLFKNK